VGESNFLEAIVTLLTENHIRYCVIGGQGSDAAPEQAAERFARYRAHRGRLSSLAGTGSGGCSQSVSVALVLRHKI
jgi:hypothetical protein